MNLAVPQSSKRQRPETPDILGDYGSLLCLRRSEYDRVWFAAKVSSLNDHDDIMTACS